MRREALVRTGECEMQVAAAKTIKTKFSAGTWRLECATTLSTEKACPLPLALGVEMVFNLLAPGAPDRYILTNGTRYMLDALDAEHEQLDAVSLRSRRLADDGPGADGVQVLLGGSFRGRIALGDDQDLLFLAGQGGVCRWTRRERS
jgi:hypothetical protein